MPTSSLSSSYMDVGADVIENILEQTSKSKVTFNNQCNLQANSQTNLLLSVSKRARITLLAKGVTKKWWKPVWSMYACISILIEHMHWFTDKPAEECLSVIDTMLQFPFWMPSSRQVRRIIAIHDNVLPCSVYVFLYPNTLGYFAKFGVENAYRTVQPGTQITSRSVQQMNDSSCIMQ